MRKKYNVLEFDALLEKITEINEVYQVMRLHNLDATIDDAVTFYEQKKREISLEAKIKEPSAVGKCVVTLDTGIDNSVYEVFVNVPYHALIGFLPERYRKHIGKEWNETTHENAVGWSSICESGIGCFFALSGALFGSQLLCWTGIYAVVEGLVRLNTIDNKKYVPSLVTKLPLTLIENIRGPLLKEEKPKLEAYFKQTSPAQVTNVLPSTKPSICKEKGNYIFSNIPHFTRDVEVLADLLDHGVFKTTPDWWNYSLTNKEGIIVPSMMDLFQLLSTAHALKDDDSCGRAAEEFLHRITSHLQHHPRRLNTCTKIIYEGGLKGTIEHLLMNKTTKKNEVAIPQLPTLANEEYSYADLYLIDKSAPEAMPFLKALLGTGYENADSVLGAIRPDSFFRSLLSCNYVRTPPLDKRPSRYSAGLGYEGGMFISAHRDLKYLCPAIGIRLR